jgi:hypothetical protein
MVQLERVITKRPQSKANHKLTDLQLFRLTDAYAKKSKSMKRG